MWATVPEATVKAPFAFGDEDSVGGASKGLFGLRSASNALWRVLASANTTVGGTSSQHARLETILLVQAPSPTATHIYETEVVGARGGSWWKRRSTVAALSALSPEERRHVRIDALIENSSPDEAQTWVRLAMECVAHDGGLPPLPQRVTSGAVVGDRVG